MITMSTYKRMMCVLIGLGMSAMMFSGCSIWESLFGKKGSSVEAAPQSMAYEGIEQMEQEDYKAASATFQDLKDRYPYSKYAILAELKMADSYYLDGKYLQATEAYTEFEQLHPNNEAVPYVIYQLGMCYFQQIGGPERDQTPVVRAIQTFSRLRETYPESPYAARGSARITQAQNSLAGHEFMVGQFYFKQKSYKAALGRFVSLMRRYPDTGYHAEAMAYIKICRQKLADAGETAAEVANIESQAVETNSSIEEIPGAASAPPLPGKDPKKASPSRKVTSF